MKSFSMLSVLCLCACGAATEPSVDGDSSLKQSLETQDDGASDSDDEAPVADDETGVVPCGDASGDEQSGDGTANGGVVHPVEPPVLVVGAAPGEAWPLPAAGTVVWCNADVVVGCPAIEPTPDGGRLVVVEASSAMAPVAEGTAPAGAVGFSATVPVPAGTAALPELPVIVGGTLPPLPGTCVSVDIGGMPTAQPAPGSAAPVPASGGVGAGTAEPGAGTAEPVAGTAEPAAGTARAALTAGAGASGPTTVVTPVPGIPVMVPLPGNCFGVALPPSPGGTPEPGSPAATAPAVPVDGQEPDAAGCFGIAFAQPAGEDVPPSAVVPVLCPASPGAGHGASAYPAPPPSPPGSTEPRGDAAPAQAQAPDDDVR